MTDTFQSCEKPTLILAKNLRCSLTVSLSKRTLCWGQMPRLCLIWSMLLRMSYPLMTAVPPVGVYRPGGVVESIEIDCYTGTQEGEAYNTCKHGW